MEWTRAAVVDFYRRYLGRCNEHRFAELTEFVGVEVLVNGVRQTVGEYGAGLNRVIETFPDFHWEIRQILIDGDWLCVRLTDTGTDLTSGADPTRNLSCTT